MNLSNKNIVHVKTDNVEYIQFKRLLEYKNIAHCYTLKSDGQLNFKTENNPIMLKSYENISKELEFTDIIKPMQKHTDNVLTIQGKQELDGVDGLITNIKNVTLATTSADCHAGRRCLPSARYAVRPPDRQRPEFRPFSAQSCNGGRSGDGWR